MAFPDKRRFDIRRYAKLYSWASFLVDRLPASVVFPPEYRQITGLLERQESGCSIDEALRQRLCSVLRTAVATVPYYRELKLGIEPRDVTCENCVEALAQFPFLEKRTVLEQPVAFLSTRYSSRRVLCGSTAGSTGQGVKLFSTYRLTLAQWAFFHHQWRKIGYRPGCRVVRIGSEAIKPESEDPFLVTHDKLYISPNHVTERWVGRIVEEIERFGGQFLHGYPSCVAFLSDYMLSTGRCLECVKGIFLASERMLEQQLRRIERAFPASSLQFCYGLSERTNLAWGDRTGGRIRYLIEPAFGSTEALVDEDGRSEIVGTSYWNEVMPLIRYRTQDFGRINGNVIEELDGREQEFLVDKNGHKISGFTILLDTFIWDVTRQLLIVQNQPGRLEMHITPGPAFDARTAERMLAAQRLRWGGHFDFSIVLSQGIPRTKSGKQQLIVNNLFRGKSAGEDASAAAN